MKRTIWRENLTADYPPECHQWVGGLIGVTDCLVIERHAPGCKPGFWRAGLAIGVEVYQLIGLRFHESNAVQDDFGNLVRVPS